VEKLQMSSVSSESNPRYAKPDMLATVDLQTAVAMRVGELLGGVGVFWGPGDIGVRHPEGRHRAYFIGMGTWRLAVPGGELIDSEVPAHRAEMEALGAETVARGLAAAVMRWEREGRGDSPEPPDAPDSGEHVRFPGAKTVAERRALNRRCLGAGVAVGMHIGSGVAHLIEPKPTPVGIDRLDGDVRDYDEWLEQIDRDYPPADQPEGDWPRLAGPEDRRALQADIAAWYRENPNA
jgi:hypothetical protein